MYVLHENRATLGVMETFSNFCREDSQQHA